MTKKNISELEKKFLEIIEAKLTDRMLDGMSEEDKIKLNEAIFVDLVSLGMHFGNVRYAVTYTYDFEASMRGHSDDLHQRIEKRIIKLKEMYEEEVSLLSEYYLNIKSGMDYDEADIVLLKNFA